MNAILSYEQQAERDRESVDLVLDREVQKFYDAFTLMGWQDLPDALKAEIIIDISLMIDEFEGNYCTIDPAILQRRKKIRYWIDCYQQKICTLRTALTALKNRTE